MRIGELVVAARLASPHDVDAALRMQAQYGGRLGSVLADLGYVELDAIAGLLSRQRGVPAATAEWFAAIDPAVLAKIPRKAAERYSAVPIGANAHRQLLVALRDPQDLAAVDALQVVAGMRLVVHVAPELRLRRALERYYGVPRSDDRFVRLSAPDRAAGRHESPAPSSARDRVQAIALSMPAMPAMSSAREPHAPVAAARRAAAVQEARAPARVPSADDVPRFAPPPRLPDVASFSLPAAHHDFEPEPFPARAPPEPPAAASEPPPRASSPSLEALASDDRHPSSLPSDAILGPASVEPPPRSLRSRHAPPPERSLHFSLGDARTDEGRSRPPSIPPALPPAARPVATSGYRAVSLPPEDLSPLPRRSEPPPSRRPSVPPPASPTSPTSPTSSHRASTPNAAAATDARASTPPPAPAARRASDESAGEPSAPRRSLFPKPRYGVAEACERIAASLSKEGVANAVTAFLRSEFACGIVFVVRDGSAIGWRGFAPGVDEDALEAIAVPLSSASPVRAAHDARSRIVDTATGAAMQRLLKLLRVASAVEVVVAPVVIRGRVVNLVLAAADAPISRELAEGVDRVVTAAGEAYVRLIKTAR
jgi:hypothetical protein